MDDVTQPAYNYYVPAPAYGYGQPPRYGYATLPAYGYGPPAGVYGYGPAPPYRYGQPPSYGYAPSLQYGYSRPMPYDLRSPALATVMWAGDAGKALFMPDWKE